VRKTYWAVVQGGPEADAGVVDAKLLRRTGRGGWRVVVDAGGQPAVTEWRVRGRGLGLVWLELHPQTGRTHQVRVHCAHLGCPVLGDPVYGDGRGTLHLLARAIDLQLDPPVRAEAPVPSHMRAAMAACGWVELANRLETRPGTASSPQGTGGGSRGS
jgi:23S rRNA-/tRNA-specific pseudouridylate synthase